MINFFDFSTIYTAIFTCNILLAIIAIIIQNEKVMINAGYKLISIFLVLTAVRFLLPIQVPFVTTIPLPQGISGIIVPLFNPLFKVKDISITPIQFIAAVWIVGIVIQGYRFHRTNMAVRVRVLTTGRNVTKESRYAKVLGEIADKRVARLHIYEIPELKTPLICGLFRPYILFPSDFSCTDQQFSYILRHEVSHYLHHDLFIKFMTSLLTIVYWWNPFGYLLNRQINLVLEMKIDDTVTEDNDQEVLEYLRCLLHLAEYQDAVFSKPLSNAISFVCTEDKILTKRFQMLLRRKQKKNYVLNLLLICLVGLIYVSSYLFIYEAYVHTSDFDPISFHADSINSFIVDNGDGTYDLYLADIKIEVLYSLDNYSNDIPVYTKEEYDHVQQKDPE